MRALLTMLAAAAVVAGCGGSDSETRPPAAQTSADGVVELTSAEQFAERFDADRGKPRLLLILSPT